MNHLRLAALAASLALTGFQISAHGTEHGTPGHGAIAMEGAMTEEMLRLPDIAVTDSTGKNQGFLSRYEAAGPVLISFLYTRCNDTCGMIRGVMQLVDQDLGKPDAPPLRLIVVSVDPWNDTPQVLAAQAAQMEASRKWDWVVASRADTPALLSAFGLQTGPIEAHEAVYLLGDLGTGKFLRISGVPDPDMLLQRAREIASGT